MVSSCSSILYRVILISNVTPFRLDVTIHIPVWLLLAWCSNVSFPDEDHISLSLLFLYFLFVEFTAISQSPENIERELCKEGSSPSSLRTQSTTKENCLISRRQPVPPADKDLESSHEKISLSCPGDTRKNSTAEELFQNRDLLGQIAELTRQNSLIKAQLSKFRGFSEDTGDCLHQPDPKQNASPSPDSSQGQVRI